MTFTAERIRADYPALSGETAWLDGAAGTQVPRSVMEAIADVYRDGLGNVNGVFPASHRCERIVDECRDAIADLTGGEPDGVVLGANMTTLTYRFAATLARTWRPGDEIVLTRLDHDANVRPWAQAAERAGATVRWADIDVPSGELPAERFDTLLRERTRLVAITAASNVLGTIPDVAAIAKSAHKVGALVYVDGVHATPHMPVDVRALGSDFYATSAYKWSGPHVGAVVAAPDLLATLAPDKLAPAPDRVPDRFETGTPPFADLAGVTAAVDHLSRLDPVATGTRRERILTSMAAVEAYEQAELAHLLDGLAAIPHVRLVGSPRRRTATAYFTVAGRAPRDVARELARHGLNVWSGHSYAWEPTGALGLRDAGGAVRAGLVHYNVRAEVERLLAVVAALGPGDGPRGGPGGGAS
ncbi:cysteine desulfurase-like protein [Nonomuraea fuscirosea]|uniref:cysteine desulfurase-like protein n=1 Tax=Nonomuraea fuscirosea TaxID=1291556 RepID=UPI0037228C97